MSRSGRAASEFDNIEWISRVQQRHGRQIAKKGEGVVDRVIGQAANAGATAVAIDHGTEEAQFREYLQVYGVVANIHGRGGINRRYFARRRVCVGHLNELVRRTGNAGNVEIDRILRSHGIAATGEQLNVRGNGVRAGHSYVINLAVLQTADVAAANAIEVSDSVTGGKASKIGHNDYVAVSIHAQRRIEGVLRHEGMAVFGTCNGGKINRTSTGNRVPPGVEQLKLGAISGPESDKVTRTIDQIADFRRVLVVVVDDGVAGIELMRNAENDRVVGVVDLPCRIDRKRHRRIRIEGNKRYLHATDGSQSHELPLGFLIDGKAAGERAFEAGFRNRIDVDVGICRHENVAGGKNEVATALRCGPTLRAARGDRQAESDGCAICSGVGGCIRRRGVQRGHRQVAGNRARGVGRKHRSGRVIQCRCQRDGCRYATAVVGARFDKRDRFVVS